MQRLTTLAVCVLVLAPLFGCDGGGDDDHVETCSYMGQTYREGDSFPAGDNCNSCTCLDSQVRCTALACSDGGVPDAAGACAPTQGCAEGPACGGLCCDTGERCENGVCMCGQNAACGTGDNCEAAGPIGGDQCGSICCGASGPCPQ